MSYFQQCKDGKGFFKLAAMWSGLKWEVTGREGKRTKFQDAKAQMVCVAESGMEEGDEGNGEKVNEGEGGAVFWRDEVRNGRGSR